MDKRLFILEFDCNKLRQFVNEVVVEGFSKLEILCCDAKEHGLF